jgi:hypothetical protein
MRNYEFKIKLPVEFIPYNLNNLPTAKGEYTLEKNLINPGFTNFLESLNLSIDYVKYFYSVPHQRYAPHTDIKAADRGIITNLVKLNFVSGGAGSEMIWYSLKSGKSHYHYNNTQNVLCVGYRDEDLIEEHRASIGWPSLIDAQTIHTLQNADEDRKCWSFTLQNKTTKKRISWDDAIEIFKDYIVV